MLKNTSAFVGQCKIFAHHLLSQLLCCRTEGCVTKQWCAGRLSRWLLGIDLGVHVCFFVWYIWKTHLFFSGRLRFQRGRLNPRGCKGYKPVKAVTCRGVSSTWLCILFERHNVPWASGVKKMMVHFGNREKSFFRHLGSSDILDTPDLKLSATVFKYAG